MLKLNLGCGGDIRRGYVNIDHYVHMDGITDADIEHLPYNPNSVDEILAQDCLEHISHRNVKDVVKHWVNLLKRGGKLEIRTPDMDKQSLLYRTQFWNIEVFSYMVYGGQDSFGNFHKCGFDMQSLKALLTEHGMHVIHAEFKHDGLTSDIATSSNPNLHIIAVKL